MTDPTRVLPPHPGFEPGPPIAPTAYRRHGSRPLVAVIGPAASVRVAAGAAASGLLFQLLFVSQEAGVNVLIGVAAILAAAALTSRGRPGISRPDAWLPVAALVFAGFIGVRAAPSLQAFDGLATLALTALALAAFSGIPVTRRSVAGLVTLVGQGAVVSFGGATRLGPGLRAWQADGIGPAGARIRRIAVGALLASLPVAVFSVLFALADPVFAAMLGRAFDPLLVADHLGLRVISAVAAAWLAAGVLVLVAGATRRVRSDRHAPMPVLGGIEAAVVLVAVDLVFGAFLVVEAGYLFGGLDTLSTAGLSYADYARHGFFELVMASLLAGAMLVTLESVVRQRSRTYLVAALALVGLTGSVTVSAGYRMSLYQSAFGWTELRFFVAAAIGWLVLSLVAAAVAIATDRSRWLPHAIVVLGLIVAVAVNVADPQTFVAGQNLRRALAPGEVPAGGSTGLDAAYLSGLGADAVPVLVDALPRLTGSEHALVLRALVSQRASLESAGRSTGWPSWNWSRQRAVDALTAAPGI